MHVEYWGLDHSPFANQLDPADYFPGTGHEEALARLDFLIANGRRLGYVLGGSGTGKSLLLEVAARQLRRAGCVVVKLNALGIDGDEFVWKLANGLGHVAGTNASALESWRAITDRLIANRYQRLSTVVMVDDADEGNRPVLAAISRLSLLDPHPEARLTLVLAAQRQRTGQFTAKLNDLCELRIELEPWDVTETANYIRFALETVGCEAEIFDEDSLEYLHQVTRGIPRRVRQLAELCLLAGAADELQMISAGVVESVHRGLTNDGVTEAA